MGFRTRSATPVRGRISLLCVGFAVVVGLILPIPSAASEPLRFAPVPRESREVVLQQFLPMARYLEQQQERPVELVYLERYEEILAAFLADEIDLAYLGALSYVRLRQALPAVEPLVQFKEPHGDPYHRCVLVSFAGDAIAPATLAGRPVALTQPLSTCGHLGADALLRKVAGFGLADTSYAHLGSYDEVALAVVGGEFAVGAMKDDIAHKFAGLGLTILAESEGFVPGYALVANARTLSERERAAIQRLLIEAPEADYAAWGGPIGHGAVAANDAHYDAVRAMVWAVSISKGGGR
jgi:phosphonate transport system substrate-binding protein